MPIEIPEPFLSALVIDEARTVCDADATSPKALFGRGLARARLGRDKEARQDFRLAGLELGDACQIQLGYLDVRGGHRIREVAAEARALATHTNSEVLRTQALHLAGLAESRLRNTADALDLLVQAREKGRSCGRRDLVAQVEDTLGMVHASSGRLDLAVSHYALSLVEKSLIGDQYGTAITLGNLGRVHLRAGRLDDAVFCFEADLEIAQTIGDRRGEARVVNDLGRTLLDRDLAAEAEKMFRQSLTIAVDDGFIELEIFNRKDLGIALMALGRLDEACKELESAEILLGADSSPVLQAMLTHVRGCLGVILEDESGVELLEQAASLFKRHHVPDLEISTLLELAEYLTKRRLPRSAENCLRRALDVARRDGYARYLPAIREAMTRLELVESAVEESGRLLVSKTEAESPEGYVLFESLGKGGFGEVFRAFDPERARIVALKRLHLERLYDVYRRDRLIATARLELEAASRIRHPGIARVFAVGTDARGGIYIVQELIDGGSLRRLMRSGPAEDVHAVLGTVELIADAMEALHARGVVHRDLKPENILLRSRDKTPVLVDFGIARVPDSTHDLGDAGVVGTIGYMAPEQLLGKAVDGAADVYALGVLTYEWLAGQGPIVPESNSFASVVQEMLRVERRSLAEDRPGLDAAVVSLVDQLLERDPGRRPTAAQTAAICRQLTTGRELSLNIDTAAGTEDMTPIEDSLPTENLGGEK